MTVPLPDMGSIDWYDWAGQIDSQARDAIATTDPRLTDARSPLAHTHSATDITSGMLSSDRLPPSLRTTLAQTTSNTNQLVVPVNTYYLYLALDVTMNHNSGLGIPTGTPANHHSIMVAAYANGAGTKTFTFNTGIKVSTGIPSNVVSVPSGKVMLAEVHYSSLVSAWVLTACTVA